MFTVLSSNFDKKTILSLAGAGAEVIKKVLFDSQQMEEMNLQKGRRKCPEHYSASKTCNKSKTVFVLWRENSMVRLR